MTGPSLHVFVPGLPITQGSKKQVTLKHGPRKGEKVMIEDRDKELKVWRKSVALAMTAARRASSSWMDPTDKRNRHVAYGLTLVFIVPRPQSDLLDTPPPIPHLEYRVPKRSAPKRPTRKPDLDKLKRAICDALKGVVYVDDSQVVKSEPHKFYGQGGTEGVWIKVEQLDPMVFPPHIQMALQAEGLTIVGVDVVGKRQAKR